MTAEVKNCACEYNTHIYVHDSGLYLVCDSWSRSLFRRKYSLTFHKPTHKFKSSFSIFQLCCNGKVYKKLFSVKNIASKEEKIVRIR